MPDRHDQIAAFYAAHADNLRRTVTRRVFATPGTIEDACQHAWCQLVRYHHVTLDGRGFSWLYCVAVREAWKQRAQTRHAVALDAPPSDIDAEVAPMDLLASQDDLHLATERRAVIRLVDQLPPRQRRLITLRAMGYSPTEVARITGDTTRTVERQLGRARRRLHDLRRGLEASSV